jgi:hypothetical protein
MQWQNITTGTLASHLVGSERSALGAYIHIAPAAPHLVRRSPGFTTMTLHEAM